MSLYRDDGASGIATPRSIFGGVEEGRALFFCRCLNACRRCDANAIELLITAIGQKSQRNSKRWPRVFVKLQQAVVECDEKGRLRGRFHYKYSTLATIPVTSVVGFAICM